MKKLIVGLVLVVAVGGCIAAVASNDDTPGSGVAAVTTIDAPESTSKPKATRPKPATEFTEGVYKVGTDIKPGTYRSSGGGYWARLRSTDTGDIIANDLKDSGFMYVQVKATDAYIELQGGPWVKVSK